MSTNMRLASEKVTGPQVNLLLAVGIVHGLTSELELLEWLEYQSGLNLEVTRLEDIPKCKVDSILYQLRKRQS